MRAIPDHIENPDAYAAGTDRRIAANVLKTWLEVVPRAGQAKEFLETARLSDFLQKMRTGLETFGKLTPAQLAAVLRTIDERKAERERASAPPAAGQHVGTLGERATLTLTVRTMRRYDGDFGVSYFFICETAEGATVVYGGTCLIAPTEGATVTLAATIHEHGQHKGHAQTVIKRPKLVEGAR